MPTTVEIEDDVFGCRRNLVLANYSTTYKITLTVTPTLSDLQIDRLSWRKWQRFVHDIGRIRYWEAETQLHELTAAVAEYLLDTRPTTLRNLYPTSPYRPHGPWQWLPSEHPHDWRTRAFREVQSQSRRDLEELAIQLLAYSARLHRVSSKIRIIKSPGG